MLRDIQVMSSICSEDVKIWTRTRAVIMAVSEAFKILLHGWTLCAQQLRLLSVSKHVSFEWIDKTHD